MTYRLFPGLALKRSSAPGPVRAWLPTAASWRQAALVGMAAASAAAGPHAATGTVDEARLAVEALVSTPRCLSDIDCRSIGVGARACGGPETYVAWSTRVTDSALLGSAVARHAALRRNADAKAGVASTCAIAVEPDVTCRKPEGQVWGVCTAAPVASGTSGSSSQR